MPIEANHVPPTCTVTEMFPGAKTFRRLEIKLADIHLLTLQTLQTYTLRAMRLTAATAENGQTLQTLQRLTLGGR